MLRSSIRRARSLIRHHLGIAALHEANASLRSELELMRGSLSDSFRAQAEDLASRNEQAKLLAEIQAGVSDVSAGLADLAARVGVLTGRFEDLEARVKGFEYEAKAREARHDEQLGSLRSEFDRYCAQVRSVGPYESADVPVYLTRNGALSATSRVGCCPHRVMVISLPKAGTYFLGGILHRLGVEPTKLHLSRYEFSDYRKASFTEMREEHQRYSVELGLEHSLPLVTGGQFAVGHVEHSPEVERLLEPFRCIFIHRNLRECLISGMRFLKDTGRGSAASERWKELPSGAEQMLHFLDDKYARWLMTTFRAMLPWYGRAGVYNVPFETLYGDRGDADRAKALHELRAFLETPVRITDAAGFLQKIIGQPTKTWSGRRSSLADYWNDAVEEKFRAQGGVELNAAFGYCEPLDWKWAECA